MQTLRKKSSDVAFSLPRSFPFTLNANRLGFNDDALTAACLFVFIFLLVLLLSCFTVARSHNKHQQLQQGINIRIKQQKLSIKAFRLDPI